MVKNGSIGASVVFGEGIIHLVKSIELHTETFTLLLLREKEFVIGLKVLV